MNASPIHITSLDDPRLEPYHNVRDRDLRGHGGLFMIETAPVLKRMLRVPDRLQSILLSPQKFEQIKDELDVLADSTPVYVVELDLMTQITGFHVHRGVLAVGYRPTPDLLTLDVALGGLRARPTFRLLLAEGLTNVDNMGALFRNAAGFGADGIVLDPTCCDPLYRKSVRVSMGHVLSVPYAVSEVWANDLERLKEEWRMTLIGAESDPRARPLWELPKDDRVGVLFGSEGRGLSATALAACDHLCAIPMAAGVPSINVAVASAVFLYELNRPPST